jgi:hypothetical protein
MSLSSAEGETRETPKTPWYILTPGKLVGGLLVVELVLLAIDRHSGWLCLAGVGAFVLVLFVGLIWLVLALLFHRRFQFGIMTLLMLMVVVAVVGGWFSWKMERAKRQNGSVDRIMYLWGRWRKNDDWLRLSQRSHLLQDVLGKDFFIDVGDVVALDLSHTNLTDDRLHRLQGLPQLQELYLADNQLTDVALEYLGSLPHLQELYLEHTQVTDAGMEHLRGLHELRKVNLHDTHVTPQGVKNLQEALPNCEIIH